jgi:hypothetical protein
MGRRVLRIVVFLVAATVTVAIFAVAPITLGTAILALAAGSPSSCGGG